MVGISYTFDSITLYLQRFTIGLHHAGHDTIIADFQSGGFRFWRRGAEDDRLNGACPVVQTQDKGRPVGIVYQIHNRAGAGH